MKRLIIPAIFILFMSSSSLFASEGNWVSWGAKKTMFLFQEKAPVGMNKNIDAKLDQSEGKTKLIMTIPLDKFDSGEADRDSEIVNMLKGDISKNMTFESATYSPKELEQLRNGKIDKVSGKLKIGDKWYDLVFNIKVENNILFGQFESKLSDFDIEPPSMLGGVMVRVEDYIALKVNLDLNTITK